MTRFEIPIYSMIAIMIVIFVITIASIVAVIVLLAKAIRYSGNDKQKIRGNHYDPYCMDDELVYCPKCKNSIKKEFQYCPLCGEKLK